MLGTFDERRVCRRFMQHFRRVSCWALEIKFRRIFLNLFSPFFFMWYRTVLSSISRLLATDRKEWWDFPVVSILAMRRTIAGVTLLGGRFCCFSFFFGSPFFHSAAKLYRLDLEQLFPRREKISGTLRPSRSQDTARFRTWSLNILKRKQTKTNGLPLHEKMQGSLLSFEWVIVLSHAWLRRRTAPCPVLSKKCSRTRYIDSDGKFFILIEKPSQVSISAHWDELEVFFWVRQNSEIPYFHSKVHSILVNTFQKRNPHPVICRR